MDGIGHPAFAGLPKPPPSPESAGGHPLRWGCLAPMGMPASLAHTEGLLWTREHGRHQTSRIRGTSDAAAELRDRRRPSVGVGQRRPREAAEVPLPPPRATWNREHGRHQTPRIRGASDADASRDHGTLVGGRVPRQPPKARAVAPVFSLARAHGRNCVTETPWLGGSAGARATRRARGDDQLRIVVLGCGSLSTQLAETASGRLDRM
jgi:hypothetical protein